MPDTNKTCDIAIIGGGPGGYVAAIRASQLGKRAIVIEKENMGGVCLNWGCIPTKALLRTAEVMHLAQNAKAFGISVGKVEADLSAIIARSRQVAKTLSSGISHLMRKNKIEVVAATARLNGKHGNNWRIACDNKTTITAPIVILATGARARELPKVKVDGEYIMTYRQAMIPKTLPKSLLIIGSGAIGMEFASFYADLGVECTVLEAAPRILPVEDEEISALAAKQFAARGIKLHTNVMLDSMQLSKKQVTATATTGGKPAVFKSDRAILAVGISANTDNLGLEVTKIKQDKKGHVVTNDVGLTDEAGVYAIGDMTGAPWLAHKASHEGIIAVEHSVGGNPHQFTAGDVAGCTYCRPQIASIGLTEAAAKEAGMDIRVGRFPFKGNGKAIALGDDEGLIKTIFDKKTGALLGAHMIGPEVTELIQGFAIARTCEATEAELMHTIFPHPTLSEAMHESVLDAYGRVLHF
ncbi:MAG: dihydrolipoyl dehydrogenase [Proteobacteria bacterium]|nr:dihydrolipoyl dehydrogenase [Pseudomonadota bacterium]